MFLFFFNFNTVWEAILLLAVSIFYLLFNGSILGSTVCPHIVDFYHPMVCVDIVDDCIFSILLVSMLLISAMLIKMTFIYREDDLSIFCFTASYDTRLVGDILFGCRWLAC